MGRKLTDGVDDSRKNAYGSGDLFRQRWSPRAMTGQEIDDNDLMALFEAAHWAPSSNNNQPWRFIYRRRTDPGWSEFIEILADGNRVWCVNAGVLIVVVSKTTFDHNGKFARTHSFDTGAAWAMLALEGARRGLVVHGMQGFDYDKAAGIIGIPEGYEVEMMAAVGILGQIEQLPEERRHTEKPSLRKELSQIAASGRFTDEIL